MFCLIKETNLSHDGVMCNGFLNSPHDFLCRSYDKLCRSHHSASRHRELLMNRSHDKVTRGNGLLSLGSDK